MAQKYKSNLKKKVLEERAFQEKQDGLKEKYDISQDKEVVVVEKANIFKFLIRTMASILRLAAVMALVALAFVGIVALVYPEPREALLGIMSAVLLELKNYLNF